MIARAIAAIDADAGSEAVDAVDEVDHVDHGDDPEHGQRVGEPAELEAADEGQGEVVDPDAAEDRDQRRADLAEQLRQGRQAADVVEHPDRGDRRGAEQDRAALAVAGQPDPAGDLDPGEDRQAGEPRHRRVVQAALLGHVDRADPEGEPLGVGNQQPGDRGGEQKGEDGVGGRCHVPVPAGRAGEPRLLDAPAVRVWVQRVAAL